MLSKKLNLCARAVLLFLLLNTIPVEVLAQGQKIQSVRRNSTFMPTAQMVTSDVPLEDDYAYHEDSALKLGRGFNPSDPTKLKLPCLDYVVEPPDSGPPSTTLHTLYVRNAIQLERASNVDLSVEARVLTGTGSFSSHYSARSFQQNNAITIVVTATTDFGKWTLKPGVHLTEPAAALLAANPRKFVDDCGSRYVGMEQRGGSVSAFVTIYSVSNDFKTSFEAEMAGSADTGYVTAKASAMFKQELRIASNQDRVTTAVFATGGTGLGGLGSLVNASLKKPEATDVIAAALDQFLSQFNPQNATAVRFKTASMKQFGLDPNAAVPWETSKERKIRELANEYMKIYEDRELANEFVRGTHPLVKLHPEFADEFKVKVALANTYLDQLSAIHAKCMANASPNTSDCDLPITGRMTFEPLISLVDSWMQPPRITMRYLGLTPEELRVVLNAPPEFRVTMAHEFNSAVGGAGGIVQIAEDYGHILTYRMDFLSNDGDVWHLIGDVPHGGGVLWWSSVPAPQMVEDIVKRMFASWEGVHDGGLYVIITDRMGRVFNTEFMKAHWKASQGKLVEYEYELVY